MKPLKQHWQINTERIAGEIVSAAKSARTEEDLKMKVEPILQKVFEQVGVDVKNVKYEGTASSFRGRSDSVYGYLTIEYKTPGKLSRKSEAKKAVDQLSRYLIEQAAQVGQQKEDFLEKAVGVALDGESIIFLRFTKKAAAIQLPIPVGPTQEMLLPSLKETIGFHTLGPYPISKESIENLLIFARATGRKPLTASGLTSVFSPNCPVTQQMVSELYSELMRAQRRQVPSRIKMFYNEWMRLFGIVYGQELGKAEKTAEKIANLYQIPGGARLQQLLFSIHTFYAFLMKMLAIELISLQRGSSVESFADKLVSQNDDSLKQKLFELENGADFRSQGIENFLEADFFSWYLDVWNGKIANNIRNVARALSDFEPATPILEPEWTQDLLQNLYESIVPQELRHDLGEYYTPNWLAGYVVDKSGYKGDADKRFLDPACGSGTFLIQAINRVLKNTRTNFAEIGRKILNNVVGFDINPLAVLTARTNYLISFARFIPHVRPISIPVYLCDSVLAPSRYVEEGQLQLTGTPDALIFKTTKAEYKFPVSFDKKDLIDDFTSKIDIALKQKLNPENFEKQLKKELRMSSEDIGLLKNVYAKIKELDDNGENGIWAKYIKNAFAPVFLGKFDYVVGNPPWIRWDFLSDEYRQRTLKLWQKYGLFSLKGYEGRLGGGKKDFSMLFTYSCADNYLKDGGILGFVITIEVFKSKGAGEGFRRFELKNTKTPLKVTAMEDMVDLKPFPGAANKTSIFFMEKGKRTKYPVSAVEWKRKKGIGRILPAWQIDQVKMDTARERTEVVPINPKQSESSWQTASCDEQKIFSKLQGTNGYKGVTGAFTTPYGVFWLELKNTRPDGKLVIQNMYLRGKWDIRSVTSAIEPDLVYPAVSGGEILKYGITNHFYLLISQEPKTRRGLDENILSAKYPLTYAYLKQFEDVLVKRAAFIKYYCRNGKPFAPFYSQFDISELTFMKYRVTWKQMASKMSAVVLTNVKTEYGIKPLISTHTTAFIPTNNKTEAHYLCAIINSELVNDFISSFSAAGRGFGTPSVMTHLAIPKFNEKDELHMKLAELSERAHELVKKGLDISDLEKEINEAVRKLWNIKS